MFAPSKLVWPPKGAAAPLSAAAPRDALSGGPANPNSLPPQQHRLRHSNPRGGSKAGGGERPRPWSMERGVSQGGKRRKVSPLSGLFLAAFSGGRKSGACGANKPRRCDEHTPAPARRTSRPRSKQTLGVAPDDSRASEKNCRPDFAVISRRRLAVRACGCTAFPHP